MASPTWIRFDPRPGPGYALVMGVCLLLVPPSLPAQDDLRQGRVVSEQWVADVAVSGGVRVGVMASPSEAGVDPDAFTVFLPGPLATDALCVEISSRDGRYSARIEYDLAGAEAGALRLGLANTRHGSELGAYSEIELAILARLRDGCAAPADAEAPFVVAGWRAGAAPDVVTVLLNSRIPAEIVGEDGGRQTLRVRCSDLEGGTTAFNLRCDLDPSLLSPTTSLYVVRRRGTRTLTPVALPLLLPPEGVGPA